MVVVVVEVVVKGKIICLRLKTCRESRGIAPVITILCTRRSFGVCIATCYELDGPGIESRWTRFSALVQTDPGAHPTS